MFFRIFGIFPSSEAHVDEAQVDLSLFSLSFPTVVLSPFGSKEGTEGVWPTKKGSREDGVRG